METGTTPPAEAQTSSPRRLNLAWPIIGVVVIVAGILIYTHHRAEEKADMAPGQPPTVAVAAVERRDLFNEVKNYAEFRPYVEVVLNAKVSGYVDKMNVDFGDKVKAGQLLATLEVPELRDQLTNAFALQQRAEADYTNTHLLFTRLTGVNAVNSNLVAQQDIDTAAARDGSAAAALAGAKADVQRIKTLLDYTQITAPFDGVITWRYADPGALIQAGTASDTQARPLVRVSDNYLLRLDFFVSVAFVKDIHPGDDVEVQVESLTNKLYHGKVARFTEHVNQDTRTMLTEIEVPNPNLELIPGMYASAVFNVGGQRRQVLSIPIESVALGDKPTVYLINTAHEIEVRAVQIGMETPTRCEVLSGLKEGEQVMVGGRSLVHAGERVQTKAWQPPEL